VLAIDGWNDHEQQPILSHIDSLLTYPDPKNWQDNTMSFFGTKVRKSYYEVESDEAYNQEAIKMCRMYTDQDQQDIERYNNQVQGFQDEIQSDENSIDIYNHLTIFKAKGDDTPCVYLTSWGL
jgi:hypothetical protein